MIMTWKLQTITGEFSGKEISVDRDMLIGRHQDADILLQAAEISRRHAALVLKDNALWVQDLKSSNGTFVNDLKVDGEVLLKEGDIVQFASQKFSVLQPATNLKTSEVEELAQQEELATEPETQTSQTIDVVVEERVETIQQPSEAIALSEAAQEKTPVTVAEKMIEQGMPDLKERDKTVQVSPEGMPQNVGIPKPAPIPEGVDLSNSTHRHEECEIDIPAVCEKKEIEAQKNASIGLFSLIALIIVAIIAWLIFK